MRHTLPDTIGSLGKSCTSNRDVTTLTAATFALNCHVIHAQTALLLLCNRMLERQIMGYLPANTIHGAITEIREKKGMGQVVDHHTDARQLNLSFQLYGAHIPRTQFPQARSLMYC